MTIIGLEERRIRQLAFEISETKARCTQWRRILRERFKEGNGLPWVKLLENKFDHEKIFKEIKPKMTKYDIETILKERRVY